MHWAYIKAYFLSRFLQRTSTPNTTMSSASEAASQHLAEYTQHLANYTQRQFKVALASLDSEKIAGLSKIPSAHSCVSQRAAQNSPKSTFIHIPWLIGYWQTPSIRHRCSRQGIIMHRCRNFVTISAMLLFGNIDIETNILTCRHTMSTFRTHTLTITSLHRPKVLGSNSTTWTPPDRGWTQDQAAGSVI